MSFFLYRCLLSIFCDPSVYRRPANSQGFRYLLLRPAFFYHVEDQLVDWVRLRVYRVYFVAGFEFFRVVRIGLDVVNVRPVFAGLVFFLFVVGAFEVGIRPARNLGVLGPNTAKNLFIEPSVNVGVQRYQSGFIIPY